MVSGLEMLSEMHAARSLLIFFVLWNVSACGDIQKNMSGEASDGSLIAGDFNAAGLGSIVSGEAFSRADEDVFALRIQSTKGWSCVIDYKSNLPNVPDNAFPIKCSNQANGLLIAGSKGSRRFDFGLSNGVKGYVIID